MARKRTILMYRFERLPQKGETFEIEGLVYRVVAHLKPEGHGAWEGLILARRAKGQATRLWAFGYETRPGGFRISEPLTFLTGLP